MFPELITSRVFLEKIIDKRFFSKEFGKELSLLAILTHGDDPPDYGRDTLITYALNSLGRIVEFDSNPSKPFSIIQVTTSDPYFQNNLQT